MSEVVAVSAGGGASKGAWEAGVIGHLCGNEQVDPKIWTGTSVGALNALAAAHVPLGEPVALANFVFDQWHRLRGNDDVYVWNHDLVKAVVELMTGDIDRNTKHSIMDTEPLWRLMRGIYSPDKIKASRRLCTVVAVSLQTGDTVEWHETDKELLKGAFASAAMPIIFPAVYTQKGGWCVDGGIRDVRPIAQAIARGATKIYDISTDTKDPDQDSRSAWSILAVALRTLGIMVHEIQRTDRGAVCEKAGVELISIKPQKDLGDPLDFGRKRVHELILQGELDCRRALR